MALIDTPSVDDFWRLLQRLAGKSYAPEDEESVWQRELHAWATLLHLGRDSIDRAFRQAFPGLSDELIDLWEQAFDLPNDTARSIVERQARLAGTERHQRGGTRAALEGALGVTSSTAQFTGNLADSVAFGAAPEASVFQSALHLTNEEFYNPFIRQAAERVFGRGIAARNLGQLDDPAATASTVVELGARHASPEHVFDRDGLIRQESVVFSSTLQPSRVKSYGPGSKLIARDINRIQEGILSSFMDGDGSDIEVSLRSAITPGMVTRWFKFSSTNTTEAVIDDTLDYRDRMVWMHSKVSDVSDIRPGGALDFNPGISPIPAFHMLYTGPGSAAAGTTYRAYEADPAGLVHAVYARVSDGALMARPQNIGGATRYAWGVLFSTNDMRLLP